MDPKESIKIVKKVVESCFVKSACYPCPFYTAPCNGKPGRCLGMRNAGNLILSYLDDIENEMRNQK